MSQKKPRIIPAIAIPLPRSPVSLILCNPINPKMIASIGANGTKKTIPKMSESVANTFVPRSDDALFALLNF